MGSSGSYQCVAAQLYDTGNWNFSKLLKDSDPIAYDLGYDDYLDANNLNEDEEDEESEE